MLVGTDGAFSSVRKSLMRKIRYSIFTISKKKKEGIQITNLSIHELISIPSSLN